jgi:hypothetical protein
VNDACTFPSQSKILVDVVLARISESVVDEADVLGPIHDTIPPPPSSAVIPHPKPNASVVKTVITRPSRGVARWPVVLCGAIAIAFAAAAYLKSPLVADGTVVRTAVAIHDYFFKV